MSNLSDYKYPEFNEDFEGMVPANGGGGSGGGGSGTMKVTFDITRQGGIGEAVTGGIGETVTADKTFEELYQAVQNGAYVYAQRWPLPAIYHLMSASEQGVAFSNVSVNTSDGVVQEILGIRSDNNAVHMSQRYRYDGVIN